MAAAVGWLWRFAGVFERFVGGAAATEWHCLGVLSRCSGAFLHCSGVLFHCLWSYHRFCTRSLYNTDTVCSAHASDSPPNYHVIYRRRRATFANDFVILTLTSFERVDGFGSRARHRRARAP